MEEKEKTVPQANEAMSFKVTAKKNQLKALYRSSLSISLVCCMFKKCVFNIKQLFSFYRELKRSLSSYECVILVDFSELLV